MDQQLTESRENRGEKQRILPQCENRGSPWLPIFPLVPFSENRGSFPAIKTEDECRGNGQLLLNLNESANTAP
ncbi:25235_t:CDS:1, partial [Cetraspora pellucida]